MLNLEMMEMKLLQAAWYNPNFQMICFFFPH